MTAKQIAAKDFVNDSDDSQKRSDDRSAALGDAVENYGARVANYVGARLGDRVEAEDVTQDVFAEFLNAYDLNQVIENVGGWLVRVAQNKIIDRFRRKRTRAEYQKEVALEAVQASSGSEAENAWLQTILRREIADAIALLPPEQAEVFIQHELEGKSFDEISRESGVPVNTLLSRKHYAILFLREQLKEIYDELE